MHSEKIYQICKVQRLHFPSYNFRFKNSENKTQIFDEIRKKFVLLQPEEWVRQHCIHFLMQTKHYPKSLINVEKQLKIHKLSKRYDIIIYNPNGSVQGIVECKAPNVKISQVVFDQIAQYNLALNASFLMVTNGINHYYCKMDYTSKNYQFLESFPDYKP